MIAYWDWISRQESVTKLSFARQFLINDITAGIIIKKFVAQRKLQMLERGVRDKGVWVMT